MDILRLLEELNEMATVHPRDVLGRLTYGLDKDAVSQQILKIRACLPQELKMAATTVRESERIIEQARSDSETSMSNARKEAETIVKEAKIEADRTLEQAKLQQERLIAESEILKLSKSQADAIRTAADQEAKDLMRGAEKYSRDLLTQLETILGKAAQQVERGKAEMRTSELPAPRQRV